MFAELLTRALDDPEITTALAANGAPAAKELREAAAEQRDRILGQARAAEEEYVRAVARQREDDRGRRLVGRLTAIGTASSIVVTLASAAITGWSTELEAAFAERRPVSPVTVAGTALGMLVGIAAIAAIAAFVTWWASALLSEGVRAGDPAAEDRRLTRTLLVPAGVAAVLTAAMLGVSAEHVVWQFTHGRPPGADEATTWGVWVTLGALAIFGGTFLGWSSEMLPGMREGEGERLDGLLTAWHEALYESTLGFVRGEISIRTARRYATTLTIGRDTGLRKSRGLDFHVDTEADVRLLVTSQAMDGGSIALAGPRGAGKSEVLARFCRPDDPATVLSVEVTAPVAYDRREFMLLLLETLCERVIEAGLTSAEEARRLLGRIRYQHTRAREANVGVGWGGWGLSAKHGTSLARQPMTYPEIVRRLKDFLTTVANEVNRADQGRRLVIGVDELDRIAPSTAARDFLNELKVVFDVPHCLFVLSVSDEALRDAELTPLDRRDAFDSAIDEVVRVSPLDYRTALRLLDNRAVGMPAPFAALFYCLSGAIPRDLLRTARAATALVTPERPRSLTEVTAALVRRELARTAGSAPATGDAPQELLQFFHADLVAAHGGLSRLAGHLATQSAATPGAGRLGATLVNRACFLDTVEQIFVDGLDQESITRAAEPGFPGSFAALARAQRETGVADVLARSSLEQIRRAWGLPAVPSLA
ncbi:P-loop NTPase fold protein [Nonomuraea dietziae]|uniref:P-loop NTPase fold protein n=1 Tax=Nonomuraea dietziae TaxID=65515 RepID=UPI0031DBA8FF